MICKQVDLIKYLPEYLCNFKEMQSIQKTMEKELSELYCFLNHIFSEMFVLESSSNLHLYEKEFGLTENKTLSDELRREIIIAKMRGTATTTKELIKNVAVAFSNGEVEIIEENEKYTIKIKFIGSKGIPSNIDEFKKAITQIIPAHLAIDYIFTYLTWDEFDGYNKSWNDWDKLNLSWDKLQEFKE